MKSFHGITYKDANKLIKKYGTNDPQSLLIERKVTLLPFKEKTQALGMYVIIKGCKFIFIPHISHVINGSELINQNILMK
jgi:hypothetical protein